MQAFHINSNANGSPYGLMGLGTTLTINAETNPFFRFYETCTRTYPVRLEDGSTQDISAIAFLNQVRSGTITPDNLPAVSLEISRHFMMLARELVWENIRVKEFSHLPSRQHCLWLIRDEEQVRRWLETLNFSPNTYQVVKVQATGSHVEVDSCFLAGDSEPLPVWYNKARRYWSGEMAQAPLPEILFTGSLYIEEIMP